MNKKIILSAIISSVLLLTSCGTKPLWTFEEEMKAEQTRYSENVGKYFSGINNFSEWKFKWNWQVSIWFASEDYWKIKFDLNHNSKWILEWWDMALAMDFWLNVNWDFSEKLALPWSQEIAWAKINAELLAKLGILDKKVYFSFDKLGLDFKPLKETPMIKASLEMLKSYINSINEKLTKKWLKIDLAKVLPEEVFAEFSKNLNWNQEVLKWVQNILIFALIQDIFKVEWEKTTYEWKQAYKFSIDEEKFQNYILSLATKFFEENKEILKWSDLSEWQISEALTAIKENKSKIKIKNSEWYLVRTSGNDVNFILKNLEFGEEENYLKISLEILDRELKVSFAPVVENKEVWKLALNFVANSASEFNYSWEVSFLEPKYNFETEKLDYSTKSVKFYWVLKNSINWNNLDELYTFNTKVPFALPFQEEKEAEVSISIKQNSTKDNNLVINEETILGKEKAMDLKEFLELLKNAFPETTEAVNSMIEEYENNSWSLEDM